MASRHPSLAARVARNTGIRVAADVASKLALFGLFAVMARELGRQGFGDFVFAVSLAFLIAALADLGTDEILAREVARDPAQINRILPDAVVLRLSVGLAALAGVTVLSLAGSYETDVSLVLVLVGASSLLELVAGALYSVFQGLGDLAPEAFARTLQSVLRAAIGIPVLVGGGGIVELAVVYLAASVVALAYAAAVLWHVVELAPRRVSPAGARSLAITGFPIGLGGAFELALVSLTIVILSALEGNETVGLFGAATRLVEGAMFIGSAFVAAMLPVLARADSPGAPTLRSAFAGGSKVIMAVLAPISLAFALFAEPLTRLAFGSEFAPASTAVELLAATILLNAVSELAYAALIVRGRQKLIPWIAGVTTLESLILTAALAPAHGFDGAAAAITIGALSYALLAVWAARTALPRTATAGPGPGRDG